MKKAAVLGYPIKHSLSPKLHGYWLEKYGIEGTYEAIEVEPGKLASAFSRLKSEGYIGWNITVPHKERAISLVSDADRIATTIGAINTVVIEKGKILGYNTDWVGFTQNIKQVTGTGFEGKTACVLGAGGAARAVLLGLMSEDVKTIKLINRTPVKAKMLANEFSVTAEVNKTTIEVVPWEEKDAALEGVDILVNTTVLGMAGELPLEINLDKLPQSAIVNDIVYKPLETELLKAAKARGNQTVDGIGMLIWQAVPAFEAWFGKTPDVTPELKQYMLSLC